MKKILLGSALAFTLAAPVYALAEGSGGYVELGAGRSDYKFDDGAVTSIAGFQSVSRKNNGDAFRIAGGYKFDENWGIEAGYADLGKASNTYNFSNGGTATSATIDGKANSLYVAGVGSAEVGDDMSLFAKLGVARNHSSGSISGSGSGATPVSFLGGVNKTSGMAGVGLAYQFAKNVSGTLEYDYYGKLADDLKANAWLLGVRFGF